MGDGRDPSNVAHILGEARSTCLYDGTFDYYIFMESSTYSTYGDRKRYKNMSRKGPLEARSSGPIRKISGKARVFPDVSNK
jgi:hypothetical protein